MKTVKSFLIGILCLIIIGVLISTINNYLQIANTKYIPVTNNLNADIKDLQSIETFTFTVYFMVAVCTLGIVFSLSHAFKSFQTSWKYYRISVDKKRYTDLEKEYKILEFNELYENLNKSQDSKEQRELIEAFLDRVSKTQKGCTLHSIVEVLKNKL